MKLSTIFGAIALFDVAFFSDASLHASRGRGRGRKAGKQGGGRANGKAGGDGNDGPRRTLLVEVRKDKERGTSLPGLCAAVAAEAGATVERVYGRTLHGCALAVPAGAADASLATLAGSPRVTAAEEDRRVYASYSWGLDRVDQCALPLEGSPTKVNATGVRIYVLDTGIDKGHAEFANMIDATDDCHVNTAVPGSEVGTSTTANTESPFNDGNGHG